MILQRYATGHCRGRTMGRISLPLLGLTIVLLPRCAYHDADPVPLNIADRPFPQSLTGNQWCVVAEEARTFGAAMSMPPQKTAATDLRRRSPNPSTRRPARPMRSFSAPGRDACWRLGLERRTSLHSRLAFVCAPRAGFLSKNDGESHCCHSIHQRQRYNASARLG
jgi:hypothetical protein